MDVSLHEMQTKAEADSNENRSDQQLQHLKHATKPAAWNGDRVAEERAMSARKEQAKQQVAAAERRADAAQAEASASVQAAQEEAEAVPRLWRRSVGVRRQSCGGRWMREAKAEADAAAAIRLQDENARKQVRWLVRRRKSVWQMHGQLVL